MLGLSVHDQWVLAIAKERDDWSSPRTPACSASFGFIIYERYLHVFKMEGGLGPPADYWNPPPPSPSSAVNAYNKERTRKLAT